jgi:heat shock protein HslJ
MQRTTRSLRLHLLVALFGAVALLGTALAGLRSAQAQSDQRCFPETGECISGRIRQFWEANGGLPVFGFPISPQRAEATTSGVFQAQWFERTRLELHPQNRPPYDVLLGRAGDIRLKQLGRDWFSFPKADPSIASRPGCVFVAETRHSICGEFLTAYRRFGLRFAGGPTPTFEESLALFGLPLSEPAPEVLEDGRTYVVQWFERARFEYHPQNAPPFNVLFGRLGAQILVEYNQPAPTPTPAPPTPTAGPGPGGCTVQATFVRDVAVPNGTTLEPGARFDRIWRVRNDGTCFWDRFRLVFSRGDQMGGPASVRVPDAEPGASVDITVPLVAPNAPGRYRGFWVFQADNGATFDGLVAEIVVVERAAPTPTPRPPSQAVGPVWRWEFTWQRDGPTLVAADPARYTLQLLPDGTLSARADCNQVRGTYSLNGTNLALALGASTLAACGPDSQDDEFTAALAKTASYRFEDGDLVLELRDGVGAMRFSRAP